jgi:predicted esterase
VRSEKHEESRAIPSFSPLTSLFSPQVAGFFSNLLKDLARLDAYNRFRRPPETAFSDAAATALERMAPNIAFLPTRSVRDAEPSAGRRPLVLFAHSTPLGMSAMAEDLAPSGFVVGVISRGADRGAYRLSVADVEAMTADLRFALDHVRSLPFVDASRVSIIGMSNGAFAALGLANQTRIDAIVSLDGTVGERAAARVLPELPSAAKPVSVPPLLHLYAPENAFLDFAELRKRPGDCFTIRVPAVAHADFLTFARLRPVDPNATHRRERVLEKFSSILRLTRESSGSRGTPAGEVRLESEDHVLGLTAAPCSAL